MQAIILAGGFGTRLRSMLGDVPKPLAPIHNKPFLAYLLEYLHSQGVTEVVLSVHFLAEQIQQYFRSSYAGIQIQYAHESQPLGTGGAIRYSLQKVDPSRPVIVLNGDTLVKLDYRALYAHHQETLTMGLRFVSDRSRYGAVRIENERVVEFQERGSAQPGYISAGIYVLDPSIFSESTLLDPFSFEKDFLLPYCPTLRPQAFMIDDYFIDIGVPEDYLRAQREF